MDIIIKIFVNNPKGFREIDFTNSPLKSSIVALVEPQEGHGIPVILLKIQNDCSKSKFEKKRKKYPDIKKTMMTRYLNL
jgi:hypothetical protein